MSSAPDFASVEAVYERHWEHATPLPERMPSLQAAAKHVLANKARYLAIQDHTGIPWFLVGLLHLREANCNFQCHLHNGDPLSRRTVQVPAGRPVKGSPPFTWEESALDALTMAPHELDKIKEWSFARLAYEAEKYNGWGYYQRGKLSPYDWAGDSEDGKHEMAMGKYVRDHVFDASVIDKQPGVMSALRALIGLDPTVGFGKAPQALPGAAVPPAEHPAPAAPEAPKPAAPKPSFLGWLFSLLFKRK